jgi:hypothetical protein
MALVTIIYPTLWWFWFRYEAYWEREIWEVVLVYQ